MVPQSLPGCASDAIAMEQRSHPIQGLQFREVLSTQCVRVVPGGARAHIPVVPIRSGVPLSLPIVGLRIMPMQRSLVFGGRGVLRIVLGTLFDLPARESQA